MKSKAIRACATVLLALSVPVAGATTIGDVGNNLATSFSGLGNAVFMFAILAGIALVVGSLVMFATHKKTNTPLSIPAIMLLAGLALVSIPTVISIGTSSTFGSGGTSQLNQLITK
jgi:hypothetical protein